MTISAQASPTRSLLDQLIRGERKATVTFAGQGVSWVERLAELDRSLPVVRRWVDRADAVLGALAASQDFAWTPHLPAGFELARWVRDPASRPAATVLSSSVVSQPAILLTQAAIWQSLWQDGLREAIAAGAVVAATGHSQGVMAAHLVATSVNGGIDDERLMAWLRVMAWQGLTMASSAGSLGRRQGEATAMAAVSGPTAAQLLPLVARVAKALPAAEQPVLSLWNTRTRHVISAPPAVLLQVQTVVQGEAQRQVQARKDGKLGGRPLQLTWEWLDVGAPFHGPAMAAGLTAMRQALAALDFAIADSAMQFPVLSPTSAAAYPHGQVVDETMQDEFVRPVRWRDTVWRLGELSDVVLDIGPGDGVGKLTASVLRGTGVRVVLLDTAEGRRQLLDSAGPGAAPDNWSRFAPRLATLPSGEVVIDNLYTRLTQSPPLLLPGMTPTTSDAPIVAAAANAGYWSELAGGGQPSARIFQLRMEELAEQVAPGRGVVLNALYLDPWLWDLQIKKGLALKLRQRGLPLVGITVSAGIPPVDEAAALVNQWQAAGLRWIAFKPGTAQQIDQVIKIARACRQATLYVHVEGGKAGGHHSWEDLEELLLDGYAKLRAEPNLVLCVGGGIGTPQRALDLLTGVWSLRHGVAAMPVDAVFLGTLAMACKEATATPSVKQALVAAQGAPEWVYAGEAKGGVTSGKSQLNADIHYLDNEAARVGRLLDQVAGDAAAVAARRDEIAAALNRTCKPYFGDLQAMTWADVLERVVAWMATGQHGRYEDGAWLDPTWRERAVQWFQRAEASVATAADAGQPLVVQGPTDLDQPHETLARLRQTHPALATQVLHPADVEHFIAVCTQRGKPVPFVPVIDGDVRRWYKSDALWQAQDPRYTADQVLIIPGPEAVGAITSADEPVAALLDRFTQGMIDGLRANGEVAHAVPNLREPTASLPMGIEWVAPRQLAVRGVADPESWLAWLGAQYSGVVAAALSPLPWLVGERHTTSLLARLCRAEGRATLTLLGDGDTLDGVRYTAGEGADAETVEVRATGQDTAEVSVALLRSPGQPRLVFGLRHLTWAGGGEAVAVDASAWQDAVQDLYQRMVADAHADGVELFEPAEDEVALPAANAAAWAALGRGEASPQAAIDLAFPLAWRGLFRAMACPELRGGWLTLLHAHHGVQTHNGNRLQPDQPVHVAVCVVQLEDLEAGRQVQFRGTLAQGGVAIAELETQLLIRGSHPPLTPRWRVPAQSVQALGRDRVTATLTLDGAGAALLAGVPWLSTAQGHSWAEGQTLDLQARVELLRERTGLLWSAATGAVSCGGKTVATIQLPMQSAMAKEDPLRALIAVLQGASAQRDTPVLPLGERLETAPADSRPFAAAGGDWNPIHHSTLTARLAGLHAPIVHGMWTATRLHQFTAEAAGVAESHLSAVSTEFLAPLDHGAPLHLRASRIAVEGGKRIVEAVASSGGVTVARSRVRIEPPKTAYVFPGQGIQRQGMGMDGYARNKAARAIWDRADAFTRSQLGFSVLEVVRRNPKQLLVKGELQVHPEGVLHLTQFTQVAMAVLAMAQVAELRDAGVLDEGAVTCGHSVGEYNALAAYVGVLPLESVVEIVWMRGCTMHTVVPRDAAGRSPYRMGVVRPNFAGLDHRGAEALVDEISSKTGSFIQIVNHNVRNRQYSVTGEIGGLEALEAALTARTKAGGKPAWVTVPGIDVPFHSSVLHSAVPAFREVLNRRLPQAIDPARLIDRYIPNLVAEPFALSEGFLRSVFAATQSTEIGAALEGGAWQRMDQGKLSRLLLVELLAWQFASPVRWIESQERMFAPVAAGGMGVVRYIEIGVGHQPTLVNMAKATLEVMAIPAGRVALRNCEADVEVVQERDVPLQETAAVEEPAAAVAVAAAPAVAVAAVAAPVPAAGASGPAPSKPLGTLDSLRALVAVQARMRMEQLAAGESLDDVFEGVSSRRNQALADLGAEFGVGAIDGAAEKPLTAVAAELAKRVPNYRGPGKYLKAVVDDGLVRQLGRAGIGRRDAIAHLAARWGLDEGTADAVLLSLVLATRPGDSVRGGKLGPLGDGPATGKAKGLEQLDAAVHAWGQAHGLTLAPLGSGGGGSGGVVDSAALQALQGKLIGPEGALTVAAKTLLGEIGQLPAAATPPSAAPPVDLSAELGGAFAGLVQPAFSAKKAVTFASTWAVAQRQLARLWMDAANGRVDLATVQQACRRLSRHAIEPRVAATARWCEEQARTAGLSHVAEAFGWATQPQPLTALPWPLTRPQTRIDDEGRISAREVPTGQEGPAVADADFRGLTALVTGASPGSIAVEVVRHLLHGGARVVVTTSTYDRKRIRFYQRLWQDCAGPEATLTIVPFNQASAQDTKALVAWLAGDGGLLPELMLPFAAMKDLGALAELSDRAEVALRAALVNVQQLIALVGKTWLQRPDVGRRCHVVLPLSPNHGVFGGDGLYAESKIGLETLLQRWSSEQAAWGGGTTLVGARIGWVRGTGLMDAHDAVAEGLEQATGVQTFSTAEMAALLVGLCGASERIVQPPRVADLTGGFAQIADVGGTVARVRAGLEQRAAVVKATARLREQWQSRSGEVKRTPIRVQPLARFPAPLAPRQSVEMPKPKIGLDKLVVVVGFGELNPCGNARTRAAVELGDQMTPAAVAELAWLCGLLRWEDGHWVDAQSGEAVADADLVSRYEGELRQRIGIRRVNPKSAGFDPQAIDSQTVAFLDKELVFEVPGEDDARAILAADPQSTTIAPTEAGTWRVTRAKGAEVRVGKKLRLSRTTVGLLPDGFDYARLGIPRDMIGSTDPVALMNLTATADAFAAAGLEPEELLGEVHPARVANTQGSGIGGMRSLHRLYVDPVLGRERQTDALQETLINVMGAYAVQAYVGSYGAMSHPVGACATAAGSIETAVDKLLLGRADFVVAGGYDDYGPEGAVGFSDMNATASADEMTSMGLEPSQMSRPNDTRRKGFVEAQGGGTFLLTRGDVALRMGLPVYAVIGYAASHADGIHRSIPAPGQGVLAVAMGGKDSPLGRALSDHGLTADDIAIVSKHDTSTGANDPNESRLHDRIQTALGRSDGNPLFVVSQKSLTGHAKGGAAAWQLGGLCQMLASGTVAGNRNLESVDPALRQHRHLCWGDDVLHAGPALTLRAGLLTSLGFGHVGALVLAIHPDCFTAALTPEQLAQWQTTAAARQARGRQKLARAMMGQVPLYERRTHRRFDQQDGSEAQQDEEAMLLTDPAARLGQDGRYGGRK